MPEVRLGIPSVVEAALLPRLIGAGRARWLVMTGETIGAAEALAWGLVEKICRPEELDNQVNKTLDAILAGEPNAMRAQKRLCKALGGNDARRERAREHRRIRAQLR